MKRIEKKTTDTAERGVEDNLGGLINGNLNGCL